MSRKRKYRIPVTSVLVFGSAIFILVALGLTLLLGVNQTMSSTRHMIAFKAESMVMAMEENIASQMRPIKSHARWLGAHITSLDDLSSFDAFITGSLAATSEIGGVALISKDGSSRTWERASGEIKSHDWSARKRIVELIESRKNTTSGSWGRPIWTQSGSTVALLHDMPLLNDSGEYIGVLGQVIPIRNISHNLSVKFSDPNITPFILYDQNYVLAHPGLSYENLSDSHRSSPLPELHSMGDPVLASIWTPDSEDARIDEYVKGAETSIVEHEGQTYLFIYRTIDKYGEVPWTIGAYVNTRKLHKDSEGTLRSSIVGGSAIMLFALLFSLFFGRKMSAPISKIASAANMVHEGELDKVPELGGSMFRELDDASTSLNGMVEGLKESATMRRTLGRFLPEKIARSVVSTGGVLAPVETTATVLFCDIEGFTQLTEELGASRIVEVLNSYFSSMVSILENNGGVITQFQGDAILATFNVPIEEPDHADLAVEAALEMLACVQSNRFCNTRLGIRIGINTGSVIAGAIGAEGRQSYTVHGGAVNLAARLESLNKEFGTRLLVSEFTQQLCKRQLLTPAGQSEIRGMTRSIELYSASDSA